MSDTETREYNRANRLKLAALIAKDLRGDRVKLRHLIEACNEDSGGRRTDERHAYDVAVETLTDLIDKLEAL